MITLRNFAVRNSALFEWLYGVGKFLFVALHPFWKFIGYQKLDKPLALVESIGKGLLFDCQMCGNCVLSHTGMSCPMNCPKNMRNGACGGVRMNGNCEINEETKCVWVQAWEGSQKMKNGQTIYKPLKPLDFTGKGSSAWLRMVREEDKSTQNR